MGAIKSLVGILLLATLLTSEPREVEAREYVIQALLPIGSPSSLAPQVAQWQASLLLALQHVNGAWSSDSLIVDILDTKGNPQLNIQYTYAACTNASVSAVLHGGPDQLASDAAALARLFDMTVIAIAAREPFFGTTNPGNFLSLAPQATYQAKATEALLAWHNFTQSIIVYQPNSPYASLADDLAALLPGAYPLVTAVDNLVGALKYCLYNYYHVLVTVVTDTTWLTNFQNAVEYAGGCRGFFLLHTGPDPKAIESIAKPGTLWLQESDANMTMNAQFLQMIGETTLYSDSIHIYDAIIAISDAISQINSTTTTFSSQALYNSILNSGFEGMSGILTFDALGFRADSHVFVNNMVENNTIIIPWSYDMGVLTHWEGALYTNGTRVPPPAQVHYVPIAHISTWAVDQDVPMVNLLMDTFNANPKLLLPGYKLYTVHFDDQGSEYTASKAALDFDGFGFATVLGPYTSDLCDTTQTLIAPLNLPQISPTATGAELSNKKKYPTFVRMIQSTALEAQAIVNLVYLHFNWNRVGFITSSDSYGTSLGQAVQSGFTQKGISTSTELVTIDSSNMSQVDIDAAIGSLQQSGVLILFIMADVSELEPIISSMYRLSWRPNAVFASDTFMQQGLSFLQNISSVPFDFLDGWVSFNPPGPIVTVGSFWYNVTAYFMNDSLSHASLYPGTLEQIRSNLSVVPLTIDSILVAIIALNEAVVTGSDPHNGTAVLDAMYSFNFTLATGYFKLDENGDRNAPFDLQNIRGNSSVLVGRLYANGTYQRLGPIIWPSGSSTLPSDVRPPQYTWLRWESAQGIAMAILAAIGILVSILTVILVILQRASPVMASATWELLLIMLLGCIVGYASIYTWIGQPNPTACSFRIFLPPLAFVLIMAPLLAKTWRLHRIFTLGSLKIVPIPLWKLFIFTGCLFFIQLILCVIWVTVGSVQVTIAYDSSNSSVAYMLCEQNTGNRALTWATFGFTGLCNIIGAYYAFRVRKLPKQFNESRFIGFSIYNAILWGVLIIVLGYSLTSIPLTVLLLICIATLAITSGCIAFIFLPKVWILWLHPEQRSSSNSSDHKNHTINASGATREEASINTTTARSTPTNSGSRTSPNMSSSRRTDFSISRENSQIKSNSIRRDESDHAVVAKSKKTKHEAEEYSTQEELPMEGIRAEEVKNKKSGKRAATSKKHKKHPSTGSIPDDKKKKEPTPRDTASEGSERDCEHMRLSPIEHSASDLPLALTPHRRHDYSLVPGSPNSASSVVSPRRHDYTLPPGEGRKAKSNPSPSGSGTTSSDSSSSPYEEH